METKPFFLFDWDPVIFNNGKMYVVGSGDSNGHITAYKKSYNLVKLDNIDVYENVFFDHCQEDIADFQRRFIEATVDRQYTENNAAKRALNENAVLSFIVREVLPALTRKKEKEEIDSLLGVKEQADAPKRHVNESLTNMISDVDASENTALIRSLIRMVEQEYADDEEYMRREPELSQIEQLLSSQFRYKKNSNSQRMENAISDILEDCVSAPVKRNYVEQNTDESLLSRVLPGPVAIFGKRVYDLVPGSQKDGFYVFLEDQKYTAQYKAPLDQVFQRYSRLLEKKFKIDALRSDGAQSTALMQAQNERDALREILSMNKFEEAGVGFLKKRNMYYVYVDTPEKYVLKSPHNNKYYLFGKARIGVSLKKEESRIYVNNPLILGSYHHPFIQGPGNDLVICLGSYSYEQTRKLPPLESVLTFLSDAKNVILSGYGSGSNPHRRLIEDNFRGMEISEDQINRDNIPVTNKAVVSKNRRWD